MSNLAKANSVKIKQLSDRVSASTHFNNTNKEPIVTFIDDDCPTVVMTKLLPIFQSENVPLNVAYMQLSTLTTSDLNQIKATGGNVCNHTKNHIDFNTADDVTARTEIIDNSQYLNSLGFDGDVIVYPYGIVTAYALGVSREASICGVSTDEGINYSPLTTFRLKRTSGLGETGQTLATCKAAVDAAIAGGGWLIFKHHCKYPEWTDAVFEEERQLIQYIKSKGVRIVNVKDGLKIKSNIIDTGATALSDYTYLGKDGKLYASELEKRNYLMLSKDSDASSINFSSPITSFSAPSNTVIYFTNSAVTGDAAAPYAGVGGVLHTLRPANTGGNALYGAYQLFYPYDRNELQKRTWNVTGANWNAWELITSTSKFSTSKIPDNTTGATAFTANNVTYNYYSSVDGTGKGFPDTYGVLRTTRTLSDMGTTQEWHSAYTNRRYMRTWDRSGLVWSAWEELAKVKQYNIAIDFGTVAANSVVQQIIALPGVKVTSTFVISPNNSIDPSIFVQCNTALVDTIRVKVLNPTTGAIVLGSRNYRITEISTT